VKRKPPGQALDPEMLTAGLGGLDSRGLAALLKELAKDRHARRAREVSSAQLSVLAADFSTRCRERVAEWWQVQLYGRAVLCASQHTQPACSRWG
jgi:hypothetical protein